MAINPNISLATASPTLSPAINAFENAMMNSQTRAARQQQMAQTEIVNPLIAQHQKIQTDNLRENQRISNTALTAQKLRPMLVGGAESGDYTQAEIFLTKNLTDIQSRQAAGENIDPTETIEALEMLKAGGGQQLLQTADSVIDIAKSRGLLNGGQQVRVTSSKILDDGTTVQSLSTGGTNVISASGNVLTGDSRVEALNNALQVKVDQKRDIAQVVSDVNVGEVVKLESA